MAVMTVLLADLVLALLLFAIFDRLRVEMMVSAIAWHCFVGVVVGVSGLCVGCYGVVGNVSGL